MKEDNKTQDKYFYIYLWLKFQKVVGFNIGFHLHFCKDCGHFTFDLFMFSFSLIFYKKVTYDKSKPLEAYNESSLTEYTEKINKETFENATEIVSVLENNRNQSDLISEISKKYYIMEKICECNITDESHEKSTKTQLNENSYCKDCGLKQIN